MKKEVLLHLIEKFLSKKINKEEDEALTKWYKGYEKEEGYTDKLDAEHKSELKNSMLKGILSQTKVEKPEKAPNLGRTAVYGVVGLLILMMALLVLNWKKEEIIQPEFTTFCCGETLRLPDGSIAVLEEDATLRYRDFWTSEQAREVWLDGSAYFEVKHLKNDTPFMVYASDSISVEVLGTAFYVSNGQGGSSIGLKSGSIKLHIDYPSAVGGERKEQVLLSPNEMIQFDPVQSDYEIKKLENVDFFFSEVGKPIVLNSTSLLELSEMLTHRLGMKITIEGDMAAQRKASGSMPFSENPDFLIKNISALYRLNVEHMDKGYHLSINRD